MVQIAVVGDGKATGKVYDLAVKVGAEIADAKAILVCGGLGGVMEACAKGAKENGGLTIGILPGQDSTEANPHIDVKVVTAMSHARNAIIARTADAVIVVGGGYGTLSEVAFALKLEKPVVLLETSGGILQDFTLEGMIRAKNPAEAVKIALEKGKALLGK
ncbi:MAG: TIGR00725 family protein [Candidatus Hydrothermarchaeaceae archaeon]